MTKSKTTLITSLAVMLVILALVFTGVFSPRSKAENESVLSFSLTADDADTLPLIKEDGKSDYVILFSSDVIQVDYTLAKNIQALFAELGIFTVEVNPDIYQSEHLAYEILIGQTNRAESAELLAELEAACANSDDIAYAYAVKGDKLLYLANSAAAFEIGMQEFLDVLSETNLAPSRDLKVLRTKTLAEYEEELRVQKEKERLERIEWLKEQIASFDDSLFGERTPMPDDIYNKPYTYPTEGQHPRLNLTADMLPEIMALLNDPLYADLAEDFWELANTDCDGILKDVSTLNKTYNWVSGNSNPSLNYAAVIEAKALAYLLTGDELYGYEAIYAAKNHMLTLEISHDIASDIFRIYGWSMMVTGEVYDWCYDLMTDLDKSQFVRGVQKYYCEDCVCGSGDKMTIGFPPTGQNAIAGHGTNVALQRDYIAFAIAIFDEYPDWWNLIGGRFYEEYVPANNVFYAAGMNTQGTNTYIWGKGYAQMYSAWLVTTMSGEMPYDPGIEDFVYGLMGLRLPNGKVFQSGDGTATPTGHADDLTSIIYLAQALFPSEIMQRNARILTKNYTSYSIWNSNFITPTSSLIFRSCGWETEIEGAKSDDLDLIWYYGSPMGLVTVRDSWKEDAAAVYMKIGELSGTNHDHQDAGTFQIYYKGCFSSESSVYGKSAGYGTSAHDKWAQATIAHNGLLVYNPAFVENEIVWGERAGAPCVSNRDTYFYSGSQRVPGGTGSTVAQWRDGRADMGTITGYASYQDIHGAVQYAYLAGDISVAYNTATVETIERRMLTVYTGIEDYPMFFVVYDYMKSRDASFQKSFLLHTTTEPVVDGNTAYFEQNGGKMVLTTLTSDAVIRTYGGEELGTYWINGYENEDLGISIPGRKCNIAEAAGGTGADKGDEDFLPNNELWGRIQIDNMGNLVDHLLNVIYVTDAGNENIITPTKFEGDQIIGMQLENIIVAFNKTEAKNRAEIEFTTEGKGLRKYYFSGLSAGSWTVKVDGVAVAHTYTDESNGLITFTAPTGTVTLIPGSDVRPANSDDIKFYANGGILPDDTQYFYTHDVEYVLPELESTEEMVFAGWYASETSTDRIYTIPAGTRGTIKVYAKFFRSYVENYEESIVNVNAANKTINGFIYQASGKTGASYKTVTDESTGNTYMLWQCGEKDPQFDLKVKPSTFIIDEPIITYQLDVALDGDNPPITSNFRLRGDHSSKSTSVFTVKANGTICLGGKATNIVTTLTDEFQTLTISVDFEKKTIYAFDTAGNLIAETALTLPTAFTNTMEGATGIDYMNACDYIFDWYSGTQSEADHALRIDNIKISAGLPANANIPDADAPNAIIYNNLMGGNLPSDTNYYYDAEKETALPEILTSPLGHEFLGWYTDTNFTNQIFSVPAGGTEQFNVYARWRMELKEDYENIEIDSYCPDSETTAGCNKEFQTIKYENAKKAGAGFKTVKDEATGNTYLVWTPGSQDPFIRIYGNLKNNIGEEKQVTYRVKLALEEGMTPSATAFRVQQTSSQSFPVFTTTTGGTVLLAGKSDYKIGDLSGEFLDVIITVDFLNAKMTVYNPDGTVKTNPDTGAPLVVSIVKPPKSEAKDLIDFINYTNYAFSWQDTTSSDVESAIRVDDIEVLSGPFVIEKLTPDSTNIYYNNLAGVTLPADAPKEYNSETGTVLPVLPDSVHGGFTGWYLDAALTERITEIPAGTKGPINVYAGWSPLFVEDFENSSVPEGTASVKISDANYIGAKKEGASVHTEEDEKGNNYLVWIKGTQDPQIQKNGALPDFLTTATTFTFSVDLARYGEESPMALQLYVRVTGANMITLASANSNGEVFLGPASSGLKIGEITDEFNTFTFSINFLTGEALAYDKDGNVLKDESGNVISMTFTPPKSSGCTTMLEWLATLTNYNFVLYAPSNGAQPGALKLDNLTLIGGAPVAK